MDPEGVLNLSGVWLGRYGYPRGRPPVSFTARLTETDSWLVGATEEKASVGEARGRTIGATLQGRRIGRSVTFLKLYDVVDRAHDSVHYQGEVAGDGSEIHGRWTISDRWSGPFVMVRSGRTVEALTRVTAEQV